MKKDTNKADGRNPGNLPTREQIYRNSHSKFRKRRIGSVNKGVIVFAILIIAVIMVSAVYIIGNRKDSDKENSENFLPSETKSEEELIEKDPYRYEQVDNSCVHSGYLILVNYMHEYVFPDESSRVNIYENKTEKYKVSYSTYELDKQVLSEFGKFSEEFFDAAGENCITINSAYRTFEDQGQIYEDYVTEYGEEAAKLYVANPGYSEHHTGYAVDLTMIFDDGTAKALKDYDNLAWINEHLVSHGFILRYPEEKYDLTKINHEPWHYRYVGVPHSYIISEMNLCLEEYTDFVKDYTCDGQVMCITQDGELVYTDYQETPDAGYEIYYVRADESGSVTNVPVPKDADSYEISGNNIDVFIVTSLKGETDLSDGIKIADKSNQKSISQ